MLNVQFSDATQETIVGYFSSPQSADNYDNLGQVATNDARWKTYYNSLPPFESAILPAPTA